MAQISLNSSMRSNLLSLQQTQALQDMTQLRLSTGLEVNSAIDNPSNYYTASSLTNRAKDLSSLLDAMSQGIQTIKAASETLATATKYLEQAKAVATQTINNLSLVGEEKIDHTAYSRLSKSWFETQIGTNDVVVTTVAELKQAIADNKSTIVVYGDINFGTDTIALNANQKLVGTEYFANINPNALYRADNQKRFSSLFFSTGGISLTKNGSEISDLFIQQDDFVRRDTITASGAGIITSLKNLDIDYNIIEADTGIKGAIRSANGAILNTDGNINIKMKATNQNGTGGIVWGMYALYSATLNIYGNVNISCNQNNNTNSRALVAYVKSNLNIYGKITTRNCQNSVFAGDASYAGNTITMKSGSVLNGYVNELFKIGKSDASLGENVVNIEAKSKIYYHNKNNLEEHKSWLVKTFSSFQSTLSHILSVKSNFGDITNSQVIVDKLNYPLKDSSSNAYRSLLDQYNDLIKDSSYKGINLLLNQDLKINFNEERSSKIDVKGIDVSTKGLGLNESEWKSYMDIINSVNGLEDAIIKLRSFSAEFGNTYSVVNSRIDFTDNLINVLTEGSDKLTLADMNESSANMLALQTRQQLAINALSLANQASQSVLRLF